MRQSRSGLTLMTSISGKEGQIELKFGYEHVLMNTNE